MKIEKATDFQKARRLFDSDVFAESPNSNSRNVKKMKHLYTRLTLKEQLTSPFLPYRGVAKSNTTCNILSQMPPIDQRR